jgi:transcriptional antiterminator
MLDNSRITLTDRLQRNWFITAMNTLNRNKRRLSKYDGDLYRKLRDGYDLVGESMSITRKQMNHIKQVAMELEQDKYDGR